MDFDGSCKDRIAGCLRRWEDHPSQEPGSRGGFRLLHNALEVFLDGVFAQIEAIGDFFVSEAEHQIDNHQQRALLQFRNQMVLASTTCCTHSVPFMVTPFGGGEGVKFYFGQRIRVPLRAMHTASRGGTEEDRKASTIMASRRKT